MPQQARRTSFVGINGFEYPPAVSFQQWLTVAFNADKNIGYSARVPQNYLRLPCGCSIGVVYKPNELPAYQKQFHVHRGPDGVLLHTECNQKISV
jgi:hypothetical protein